MLIKLEQGIGDKVRSVIKGSLYKSNNKLGNKNVSLNQILYGPPGTGKTYNTVNYALDVIGVDTSNMTREEMKQAFDEALITDWENIDLTKVSPVNINYYLDHIFDANRLSEVNINDLELDQIDKYIIEFSVTQINNLEVSKLQSIDHESLKLIIADLNDNNLKFLTSIQLSQESILPNILDLTKANPGAVGYVSGNAQVAGVKVLKITE